MSFEEKRRALIFRPEGLVVQGERDTRRGKDWCLGDLALTEQDWESSVRGYMAEDRVVFFKGTRYEACLDVSEEYILTARDSQQALYHRNSPVDVYTGVVPGEPGVTWDVLYKYNFERGAWEFVGKVVDGNEK